MSDNVPDTDYVEVHRTSTPCLSGEGCTCLLDTATCVHSNGSSLPSDTRSESSNHVNSGDSSEDRGSEDNATSDVKNQCPCSVVYTVG
ncbi:hypothetical protein BDA96_09G081100 [Sorghum bicolor]|uniref:Uncharacterized protein n=1 Tax=Sorghum bicolor TaxID=4558 RepID=A0A921Q8Z5_SORBI|nr:hypothetical protein BDA96_09G081100 [Sorghum bicolor]